MDNSRYFEILRKLQEELLLEWIDLDGYKLPKYYKNIQQEIDNFEVYDDDIWICSFPKSGTTWTQEMVWMIAHNLDYKSAEVQNEKRMPNIELSSYIPPESTKIDLCPEFLNKSVEVAKNTKRPRIFKTHLPFVLLPKQIRNFEKNPKIIYVYRNIKDTCVSYYYHHRLFSYYREDFQHFSKRFLDNKVYFAPMVDCVQSYWKHKNRPNFLLIRYEDMKSDLEHVVHRVCKFMNKSFPQSHIDTLVNYLSFDSMKNNKFVNKHDIVELSKTLGACSIIDGRFMRSGKSGGYKIEMTPEIELSFDNYLKEKLVDTDLQL